MLSRLKRFFAAPYRHRPHFFDPVWYLETYSDVADVGMDPLRHYLRYGRHEGRLPCFMVSVARERDLRCGLSQSVDGGLGRLAHGLVCDQTAADKTWAALALARASVRHHAWKDAASWLDPLHPQVDLIDGFQLLDPSLLAIEVWMRTSDTSRAQDQISRAAKTFGAHPDLILAEANLAAARDGFATRWQGVLHRLYQPHRLSGVRLTGAAVPAFDRLVAQPTHAPKHRHKRHMAKMPLVSVIIPARDAGATIATALRSLIAQSWDALEIIVVDNGSRDDTARVVRDMATQDDRIKLLDGSMEHGTYGARNLGMDAAQGAFLTVLDADDWAHPDRIARQARALVRAPSRVVATLSAWVRTTPDLVFTRWWKEDGLIHPDISSLMIRTQARARLGYWDNVRVGADSEYLARLRAVFGPGAVLDVLPDVPLSFGRVHQGSLTQNAETPISSYFIGARRSYEESYERWHDSLRQDASALPLPRRPERRPFAVPDSMTVGPADIARIDAQSQDFVSASGFYDRDWYLRTYADLRAPPCDGALHFATSGEAGGRSPGPGFSPSAYEMAYGPFETSPLQHFTATGRAQGHTPLPDFAGALPAPQGQRHILVFGHQAGPEIFGAERCLLDTLEAAAAAQVTVSVVLPHILNRDYLNALIARCYHVYIRPYGWRFGDVAPAVETVRDLAQLIKDVGADEVHQNTCVLDAPLHAARAAGVPSVVHVHELPATDQKLCIGLGLTASELRVCTLQDADRFITNSQPVLDWLDAPPSTAQLVPNRIDADLAQLPFVPHKTLRIGLVGNLVNKKGIRDFVKVAIAADKLDLDARFLLIGPMTPDLAHLGVLPRNVAHIGYFPRPSDAIAQCDIVMSLSTVSESFGRTVLEAMAAGRPVVCYDRGVPPDLVGRDGRAGRVIAINNPKAAADSLLDLASDRAALEIISQEARRRAILLLELARANTWRIFASD